MTDLVPVEAYRDTVVFSRGRLGVFTGVFFGAGMALVFGLFGWQARPSLETVFVGLAAGSLAGLVFGWLFPRNLEKKLRKISVRAYEGKGRFAAPAPSDSFTHRLPSSLVRSPSMAVGGVLYVGPDRVVFVPHSANLPQHRSLVEIPRESLTVSLRAPRLTTLQRFLVSQSPERLVLAAGESFWELVVPSPGRVRDALVAALG
jgi:hypothetical protein